MADLDLNAAFGMPPKDAVSYFRSKGYEISDRWQEVWAEAHARAFTVAKAMRMDVLTSIRAEVDKALAEGITERQFIDHLTPRLKALGWWGQQTWVDTQGTARNVQLGSPHRLKLIYRQNLQTAYMAGRYRRQLSASRTHPYWMYVAVMDSRTRPAHAALNGRVFRWDDPIWQYLYPPNGWGCRCRVRMLSARQVERMGLQVEQGEGYIETFETDAGFDERTGEVYRVQHMRAALPDGRTMSPDVGWAYNPGAAAYGTDAAIARKLGQTQSTELRSQLIQTLNNSPLRHQQFADWVDAVQEHGAGQGVQTLGFMPETVATAVTARLGTEPSRLMVVGEQQLLDAASHKHRPDDLVLTPDEFKRLPQMIQQPEAVLWEADNQVLLLIYPAEDGGKIKVVMRLSGKPPLPLDGVINAFKVSAEALEGFEVLMGELKVP